MCRNRVSSALSNRVFNDGLNLDSYLTSKNLFIENVYVILNIAAQLTIIVVYTRQRETKKKEAKCLDILHKPKGYHANQ